MKIPKGIVLYILPAGMLLCIILFFTVWKYSQRITHISQLPASFVGLVLKGDVIGVGDGDGFRMIHRPLIELSRSMDRRNALIIRLAAIDAPEVPSFGKPGQRFSQESKMALSLLIKNKMVKIQVLDVDRYGRIVAMVYVKKSYFHWKNVNLEMVILGMACVYRSKITSFGGLEDRFNTEELKAKRKGIGVWSDESFIHPQKYKKLHNTCK